MDDKGFGGVLFMFDGGGGFAGRRSGANGYARVDARGNRTRYVGLRGALFLLRGVGKSRLPRADQYSTVIVSRHERGSRRYKRRAPLKSAFHRAVVAR